VIRAMRLYWTIDTYVLYKAAEADGDAIELLNRIRRRGHFVILDSDGCIEKEYQICLDKAVQYQWAGREMIGKWFKNVVGKLAFTCCGKVPAKHKKKLLHELGFHAHDCPFVGVCYHSPTPTKRLVSEDSHYSEPVKDYLRTKLAVSVIPIIDALAVA
jgi:hypothetical protein